MEFTKAQIAGLVYGKLLFWRDNVYLLSVIKLLK